MIVRLGERACHSLTRCNNITLKVIFEYVGKRLGYITHPSYDREPSVGYPINTIDVSFNPPPEMLGIMRIVHHSTNDSILESAGTGLNRLLRSPDDGSIRNGFSASVVWDLLVSSSRSDTSAYVASLTIVT